MHSLNTETFGAACAHLTIVPSNVRIVEHMVESDPGIPKTLILYGDQWILKLVTINACCGVQGIYPVKLSSKSGELENKVKL